MLSKNDVVQELYEILENLMYPEIAQTGFKDFESTILTSSKRTTLLHWLLQESSGFDVSAFNKLKGDNLDDKLFKCYSQIGLCNDKNIFLGRVPIDEQLQFLSLLTLLIKSVHLTEPESLRVIDKKNANMSLKIKENEDLDCKLSTDNAIVSANGIKNDKNTEIGQTKDMTNDLIAEKHSLDTLCSNVDIAEKELSNEFTDNFETVLQKFNTSFQVMTSLPPQETSTVISEAYSDLNIDIENIHATFLSVNKTVTNESKIKNKQIPEKPTRITKPLSTFIKDNLVLIEQACNLLNE